MAVFGCLAGNMIDPVLLACCLVLQLSTVHKHESEYTADELVTDCVIINQRLHSPLQRRHQTFRVHYSRKLFHLTRHCCYSEPAISLCYLQSCTASHCSWRHADLVYGSAGPGGDDSTPQRLSAAGRHSHRQGS